MKNGYDGAGIPISRSGPTSGTAMPAAGEAWDSRGVGISHKSEKDGGEKATSSRTVDGARAVSISRGGW